MCGRRNSRGESEWRIVGGEAEEKTKLRDEFLGASLLRVPVGGRNREYAGGILEGGGRKSCQS